MSEAYADIGMPADDVRPVEMLLQYADMQNVAEALDATVLNALGDRVVREYESDYDSMSEWRNDYERGQKLIGKMGERKTFPWQDASNVKLPMLTQAAVRFGAEAYGEICRGNEIVKTAMPGMPHEDDEAVEARGKRVAEHMNYQLTYEMDSWEPEMDRLLTQLPFVGCLHKKTYFDPVQGTNVSELVPPECFVIDQEAKTCEKARRISQKFMLSGNELHELKASGLCLDQEYASDGDGEDVEYECVEQHRWIDLDGDGYEEPYIVRVHLASKKVMRIVARFGENDILLTPDNLDVIRIKARCYFTKYGFIPSLDGTYMDIGWSHLAGPLIEVCNTLVNQIVDAGTMANAQAGFIDQSVKVPGDGGAVRFQPGEWKRAKFGASAQPFVPLPAGEPSQVLFALFGAMVEMTDNLMAVTDVSLQDRAANMPATSVLAMIEQGKKVYSAIHKRIYRSLKGELNLIYMLNGVYGNPLDYARVLNIDPQLAQQVMGQDYNDEDLDVLPVANPELSSRFQELVQAESLLPVAQMPGADPVEVTKRYVNALGVEKPDEIIPPPNEAVEQHQSALAQIQMQIDEAAKNLELLNVQAQEAGLVLRLQEREAQVSKAQSEAVSAEAEASHASEQHAGEAREQTADAVLAEAKAVDFQVLGNPERIDKSSNN